MKKLLLLTTTFTLSLGVALVAAGCDDEEGAGNVCKQAGKVITDDCGVDPDDGDGGGEPAACEGSVEASAQCVLDYPDQACALFDDPANTDAYADYAACVADASA